MVKICATCGKKVIAGMTSDDGDFYTHEGACFESYMDKEYGKHRWMVLGNHATDAYGGYYVATDDSLGNDTGIIGTGIYYTEWESEEEE